MAGSQVIGSQTASSQIQSRICPDLLEIAASQVRLSQLGSDPALVEKIRQSETIAEWLDDGFNLYAELRSRVLASRHAGKDSFSFIEATPDLLLMVAHLNQLLNAPGSDLSAPGVGSMRPQFEGLQAEAFELARTGVPYHSYIRFYFRYIKAFDRLRRTLHPELEKTGHYHENNAAEEVEPLLAMVPDVFLFPSSRLKPPSYFVKRRPFPLYIIDYSLEDLKFLDGYDLSPKERAYHDVGHAAFMARHDVWLIQEEGRPADKSVQEWARSAAAIEAKLNQLRSVDKDLARACNALLFEILHERGYQYFLPFLLQQLETDKWEKVVLGKLKNGYFERPVLTESQALRLSEARQWLLELTKKLNVDDFNEKLELYSAGTQPVRIRTWYPIQTFRGTPIRFDVQQAERVMVSFQTDSGLVDTRIYEIALAQVSVAETRVFDAEKQALLERLLYSKNQGLKVGGKTILALRLDPEGNPIVTLESGEGGGREVRGSSLEAHLGEGREELSAFVAFKIEQVLYLWNKRQETNFTVTRTHDERTGTVDASTIDRERTSLHPVR